MEHTKAVQQPPRYCFAPKVVVFYGSITFVLAMLFEIRLYSVLQCVAEKRLWGARCFFVYTLGGVVCEKHPALSTTTFSLLTVWTSTFVLGKFSGSLFGEASIRRFTAVFQCSRAPCRQFARTHSLSCAKMARPELAPSLALYPCHLCCYIQFQLMPSCRTQREVHGYCCNYVTIVAN